MDCFCKASSRDTIPLCCLCDIRCGEWLQNSCTQGYVNTVINLVVQLVAISCTLSFSGESTYIEKAKHCLLSAEVRRKTD